MDHQAAQWLLIHGVLSVYSSNKSLLYTFGYNVVMSEPGSAKPWPFRGLRVLLCCIMWAWEALWELWLRSTNKVEFTQGFFFLYLALRMATALDLFFAHEPGHKHGSKTKLKKSVGNGLGTLYFHLWLEVQLGLHCAQTQSISNQTNSGGKIHHCIFGHFELGVCAWSRRERAQHRWHPENRLEPQPL